MRKPASFQIIKGLDDGIDLVVSFGIGPYAERASRCCVPRPMRPSWDTTAMRSIERAVSHC